MLSTFSHWKRLGLTFTWPLSGEASTLHSTSSFHSPFFPEAVLFLKVKQSPFVFPCIFQCAQHSPKDRADAVYTLAGMRMRQVEIFSSKCSQGSLIGSSPYLASFSGCIILRLRNYFRTFTQKKQEFLNSGQIFE